MYSTAGLFKSAVVANNLSISTVQYCTRIQYRDNGREREGQIRSTDKASVVGTFHKQSCIVYIIGTQGCKWKSDKFKSHTHENRTWERDKFNTHAEAFVGFCVK